MRSLFSRRWWSVPAMACGLLSLMVAVCAQAETLRIAVSRTPLSLPLYVAQEQGYFTREGVDVLLQECIGGQRCLKALLDSQVDLATVAELPLALAAFDRAAFAILATIVHARDDVKIVVRGPKPAAGQAIRHAGLRIGVPTGSTAQYVLDLHFVISGVDPRTVRTVNLPPESMVQALTGGQVDAIAIWEPYGFLALQALGANGHVVDASHGYVETFNLVAHRRVLPQREPAIDGVMRAMRQAEQFIQAQPDAAQKILRQRLNLEADFLGVAWPMYTFRLTLDQSLLATMESQARWALREHKVDGITTPNYLSFVHAEPLRRVKPHATLLRQ